MLLTERVRPEAAYPVYPPYHRGRYLEEYFFDFYQRNVDRFSKLQRQYIPIFWTNCYVNGVVDGWGEKVSMLQMQGEINKLDPNLSYFTVCQHDDAPMNIIPSNSIVFSAGGNVTGPDVIPIPLICGPLSPQEEQEKTLLASFVGSDTHGVRSKMIQSLNDHSDVYISSKVWEPEVKIDTFVEFIETSLKSKFILCPRGYGPSSFRLYEAMQLNSVPVYISDRFWVPWIEVLDWNEFCIFIPEEQIPNLHSILNSIDDDTYKKMKSKIKEVYNEYFTLEGTCNNILKKLESEIK